MKYRDCNSRDLYIHGVQLVTEFCSLNKIDPPSIKEVPADDWALGTCAYYRRGEGIRVCIERCARLAPEANSRMWSWPGNTVDREPMGVLCHELGHHIDCINSVKKELVVGRYSGLYSTNLRKKTAEPPVSNYCDNDGEWFAEIFRVFVMNPTLLKILRPKVYSELIEMMPCLVSPENWISALGEDVPSRIVSALRNKVRTVSCLS